MDPTASTSIISSIAQLTTGVWTSLFSGRFGTEVCNNDVSGFAGGSVKKEVIFSTVFRHPNS